MHGVGPPLVTPFDPDGSLNEDDLVDLVGWVEARGVDFVVPCGSNSEAELMTFDERARVVELVAGAASVPVLAGTGHPGYAETLAATEAAAEAGADAALVVTPFYYNHDQATLEAYYRDLADAAPIPIYLYSVPQFTGVTLGVDTVAALATHDNVAGMKDSSGDLGTFIRIVRATADASFEPMIGHGGLLAQALEVGATGGVLALANVAPEETAAIVDDARDDPDRARRRNVELAELNRAVTGEHGIPGLKWAMRRRGAPAGHPRSPHRPPSEAAIDRLDALVDDLDR